MQLFAFYDGINWPFHYFFMLFFLALGLFLWWRDRSDKKGWAAIASQLEMEFQESVDSGYNMILGRFELFGGGSLNQLTQMLSGKYKGNMVYAFNWFYRSDDSLQAVRGGFACVIMKRPRNLPPFRLFPTHYDNYLSSLSADRVVIGPDEFNQRFHLACRGIKEVQAFFHEDLIQTLQKGPDLLLESGKELLLFAWEGELTPANVIEELDRISALADHLPD